MPIISGPDSAPYLDSDVSQLRAMVNDPMGDDQEYTDEEYGTALNRLGGKLARTAAYFWGLKASKYAELTDITEANSSRAQGNLYRQALEMQKFYSGVADSEDAAAGVSTRRTRIGKIVREKVDSVPL